MPRTPAAKTPRATARPKAARTVVPPRVPRAAPGAVAELRAVAHPLRLRLLELFAQGARTTKQAAAELGEPPTRLYHHVHALERAGLLRLRETRAKRGTEEKYYELAPDVAGGGWAGRVGAALVHLGSAGAPLVTLAEAVLDATRGDVTAALANRGVAARPDAESPLVARVVVPSAALAAELRADLLAILRRHRPHPEMSHPEAPRPEAGQPGAHDGADAVATGAPPRGRPGAAPVADGPDEDGPDRAHAWSLTVVLVPLRRAPPAQAGDAAPGRAGRRNARTPRT